MPRVHWPLPNRFSLRALLIATTVAAVLFALVGVVETIFLVICVGIGVLQLYLDRRFGAFAGLLALLLIVGLLIVLGELVWWWGR